MTRYGREYLEWRRGTVDPTEWLDVYWALRALGIPRDAYIVDLGAGEGFLVRFLRGRGYWKTVGFDVAVENEYVRRMDLTRELPHDPDVCVFQHFLEHIPQDRALAILAYCLTRGYAVVGILPGHHVNDPTHVVNHYEYEDVVSMMERLQDLMHGARVEYRVEPDTVSFLNPRARDWVLAASTAHPGIPPLKPLRVRLALKSLKAAVRALWRLQGVTVK